MKLKIFINNPEYFLAGEYFVALHACAQNEHYMYEDKQVIAEVEIDIDAIDTTQTRAAAVQILENEMEQKRADFTAGMEGLQARKESLLAIEHKPDE